MTNDLKANQAGNELDDRPRIGILTSGGDCPGLNAVIRAVTKTGFWLGYQVIGFRQGFEGLIDPIQYEVLSPQSTAGILVQGGTILGSTNKGRFGARVGKDGRAELAPGLLDQVRDTFERFKLEGLIIVGGDGSLSTALQFHEAGLPVVGVPKTIDNDLSCTAYTFGFNSAVLCCSDALDRLHTTAASHGRVMVLEVMGRHTGWIALHGGIAGGGDVILIPEIPWTYENIVA
ncbi:MAG: 6-phosphofructokinase, partial [Rubripirellula sp.]